MTQTQTNSDPVAQVRRRIQDARDNFEKLGLRVFDKESLKDHDRNVQNKQMLYHGIGLVIAHGLTLWLRARRNRKG